MRLTQEQIDTLDRESIERETAEKIFAELWDECTHYAGLRCHDCLRCMNELTTKYLGDKPPF